MKKLTKITSIVVVIGLLLNSSISLVQGKQVQLSNYTSTTSAVNIFKTDKNLSGFKLESKKWIEDIHSTAMIFKHVKSGAKLIYLQNQDENKVFSISFRTPVHDNTGVNHIIEHSVLCGSQKYPVKDPFLIMTKQSLSTFINAFTGPDFTMYPVASKNDKDFENLMSVYLDAVFYPNISKDPRILKQEGWHYEVNKESGELNYNGIVYNEMKGAYSSPQVRLSNTINKSLFKDTSYSFESGGNPENIPELSYEKFIETYKKYYVPSNSSIYLYGKLNIENTLKFIDDNYLSKIKNKTVDSEIKLQKNYEKNVETKGFYPIAKDAKAAKMTYLSTNYVIDKVSDVETVLGFEMLQAILLNTEDSPLRKALLSSGIGANSYASFNTSTKQPIFSIIATNANESEKYKFKNVVETTLKQIVKEGFDEELIRSVFTAVEFSLHSENSEASRGMNYMSATLNSWNNDVCPTEYLETTPSLNKIKSKISHRYFEKLIQKYLLENKHNSLVVLKPINGLNEKSEELTKNKLAAYKASLSEIELAKIKKDAEELKKWQDTGDTSENLSRIPTLDRGDLNLKSEKIITLEKIEGGIKVLCHPVFTDGIIYSNLYFDSSKVPQNKILYLKLLANVLGNVSTEKYDFKELSNKIRSVTGGITFSSTQFKDYKDSNKYYPKMSISVNALNSTLPKALELLEEIMSNSKFEDKKRIKSLISSSKANYESMFVNGGNSLAIERTLSYLSDSGKYNDLGYLPYYNFICDLDKNFETKFDDIVKNLHLVKDFVFNKEGLVVSYTGDEKYYSNFASGLTCLAEKINEKTFPMQEYKFDFSKKNEAFITQSQVQYVVKAGSFKSEGVNYNGKMKVVENVLNSDYLWKELRVKGGAYGGAMSFTNNEVLFYSYRDPNLKETLKTFDGAVNFLKNFKASEKEMDNYIIGTIGSIDSLSGPYYKGLLGDNMYFTGNTQDDIQKLRDEVLSTTAEDIRNFAQVLEAVIKQDSHCVVGSEIKIKENSDLFDKIIVPINNYK
ncbi:insulinase family protein [Clostridium sp. CF012]|uniref:insulinase family protein n=1 Tax=Clostridium sp. CF012 TaxID=2843319 RepID=UPI001C0C8944|nr:insulinase family protein [Clostridium sp. CF012]MBU3143384.1 insulinase family protein [Clostridium sp. CF012]